MDSKIRFFFKEQWWFISALCKMSDEEWNQKFQKQDDLSDRNNDVYYYKGMDAILTDLLKKSLNLDQFKRYFKDKQEEQRTLLLCQNLRIESQWHNYIKDYEFFNFQKKQVVRFKSLGFFGFRIRLKPQNNVNIDDIIPNDMQQISAAFYIELRKVFGNEFQFDQDSAPFIYSISDRYSTNPVEPGLIQWNRQKREEYKKGIGEWVEVYSGQYEDYNEELYDYRIENNLSNRLSELHYIMRNSAFIYMNPENFKLFFIKDKETPNSSGYIFRSVIITTIEIRTLLFGMLLLDDVIDEDTIELTMEKELLGDPQQIKNDLDYTLRLKNTLQSVLSPVFTDLNKNNRYHYNRVLNHVLALYGISNNWDLVQRKIESNMVALENIYLDKQRELQKKQAEELTKQTEAQQKASQKQQAMLTLLQLILGTGVIFDILVDVIDDRSQLRSAVLITIVILGIISIYILSKTYYSDLKFSRRIQKSLYVIQWVFVSWIVVYSVFLIYTRGFVFDKELEWVLLGVGIFLFIYLIWVRKKVSRVSLQKKN